MYESNHNESMFPQVAALAAQWGADQELEACCEWVGKVAIVQIANNLRTARRPKPPSLKEQALKALERVPGPGADSAYLRQWSKAEAASLINDVRRALEALPND
jgi:hypothetical protein